MSQHVALGPRLLANGDLLRSIAEAVLQLIMEFARPQAARGAACSKNEREVIGPVDRS